MPPAFICLCWQKKNCLFASFCLATVTTWIFHGAMSATSVKLQNLKMLRGCLPWTEVTYLHFSHFMQYPKWWTSYSWNISNCLSFCSVEPFNQRSLCVCSQEVTAGITEGDSTAEASGAVAGTVAVSGAAKVASEDSALERWTPGQMLSNEHVAGYTVTSGDIQTLHTWF